ncbi:YbfB/YjiJ family MFS transporter [Pseudomonas nicosulfuronedens]|uniref:YbfB/YjiJ family MFS transporter n=1 Tax=Pseudomonas nicosulfuronedens TaxID=2571105 RepID=A0A5R9RBU2_9PSED|nr:YbfB/YjiJ family MFS transporter [Pseudomonas nicosulfuronedens]MDH1010971.1 YbfB/YjiJ family MFS transporter [Pseudomonas nicosulfuronedens]MDH1979494.1 YbfB/YjiJ family MFS transporter [Pseudomonas nicosulfuronedens]MDH2026741.1 YbfB/YjiJ family MFS transporter [Pseudomonas nicosulfuronedens]TLX79448.1 YbfB/YjiJ family MFS transporter [Pseudomonas nicosulfuronedens]
MSRTRRLPAAVSAALILAVGMGFGRFAFTGLYPLMVRDGMLSITGGSLAASANYAGYLLGALLLSRSHERHAARICVIALVGTLATLAAMALPGPAWFAIGVRLLAGVLSAMALVSAAQWLLQSMGESHGAPMMFAGVGIGILVSAELIAAGNAFGLGSAAIWCVLALAGLVLSLLAAPALGREAPAKPHHTASGAGVAPELSAPIILLVYGLAGFGYIITATYLPLLMKSSLGAIDPLQVWAAFGLGAAPSCFLWHRLHLKLGGRRALALNLLVQAVGVMLPALGDSAFLYLGSAVLVGGSFMGTVTIAMPAARMVAAQVRFNMLAAMTALYGVGQIIGPLAASALRGLTGSFIPALGAAASALLVGAFFCLPLRRTAPCRSELARE